MLETLIFQQLYAQYLYSVQIHKQIIKSGGSSSEHYLPPQGFGPEAKSRGGTPRVPRVYVYAYKRNIKKVLKKCVGSMGIFSIWWK